MQSCRCFRQWLSPATGVAVAITATGIFSGAAHAINCADYAGRAVAAAKNNVKFGCGYKGRRWSANFQGHYKWCSNPSTNPQRAQYEENYRLSAVHKCKQTWALKKKCKRVPGSVVAGGIYTCFK